MPRVLCPRCVRPLSVCICEGIDSFASPVQVVILQTVREQRHAINSGRIVRLAVSCCKVFTGEDFSGHEELISLLERWHGRTWLLYPGEDAVTPAEMANHSGSYGEGLLVVLDATWRKSKRMLHLAPRLAALPKVALPESSESRYRIRKVPGQGYLSTVEAVTSCLEQAGHPMQGCQQMLQAFDNMIRYQINAMGEKIYKDNYG